MNLQIMLPNGAQILPTKGQVKAIYNLLFEDQPEDDSNSKVAAIKEANKGKRHYNAILGKRDWGTEKLGIIADYVEMKKQQTPKIPNILLEKYNRTPGAITSAIHLWKKSGKFPELNNLQANLKGRIINQKLGI